MAMIGKRLQMILMLIFLHQLLFAQGNEMAMNVNAFAFTASETPQDVILTSFLEKVEKEHEVYFNYDPDLLKDKRIDQEVNFSENLESTLNEVLTPHQLRIKKMGENYYAIVPDRADAQNKEAETESLVRATEELPKMESRPLGVEKVSELLSTREFSPRQINMIRSMANAATISGKVTDQDGEPLIGVNVIVKGTNQGTATDFDGEFVMNNVDEDATLVISYVGYQTQEVKVEGRTEINIVLIEDSQVIDEVVVVGYSSVDRRHVASSIETMDMDKVRTRPLEKMETAFSGTIPGVTMMQGSNLPGSVPGSIHIRGISTLQSASPLVIVDGMEQSLTDIDPNQIKSINVLKDAAAASMYGSRGANGVIIIETERGTTGEFKVDLHTWAGVQSPIDLPDFVNAADYMRLNNEAREIQGQSPNFDQSDIEKAESGEIPTVDWLDLVMERQAYTHNTSASISGGGGVGTFNLMLGYQEGHGLNFQEGTNKFSARFNTNINIADKLILLADFYAHQLHVDRLHANSDGHGLYQQTWYMNPTQQPFYEGTDIDKHYILHDGSRNPLARIHEGGIRNNIHDRSTINLRPRYYISDNLHIAADLSYMINKSANKHERKTFKFYDGDGKPVTVWGNSVDASQGVSTSQITARALINYEQDLRQQKDKIYLIGGTEVMNYIYTDFREISKSSFFGKLNYSFDDRYLLETTVRTDGSSKFAPGHQWGFFPSASFGWNMHNEGFFSDLKERGVINTLKMRASYGLIGNENVEPYLWQEIVNNWGWTMRVPNPEFTWEKQKQANLGIDVTLLDRKLDFTADVYHKHSFDLIYSNFPVPPLTGSHSLESSVNIGEVENKGWEFSVGWNDNVGDLHYSVRGMIFDNRNRVLKAGHAKTDTLIFKGDSDKIWYRGIAVDNYYGFETDGYFQSQEEIDATSAKLPNTRPGDIKYVDQNGDGIINDEDRVNLGDPFPHYNYSISVDLNYRRWDLSVLGQGVGQRTGRLNGMEGYPVYMDGATNSLGTPRQYYMDNRWTPENPDSRFPRVWTGSTSNDVLSDVWLSDASFFRIKSFQVGYTIPSIGKGINNLRLYFNAQDALTFTKWEGLEPERNGGNGMYPRMATYSIGARATLF